MLIFGIVIFLSISCVSAGDNSTINDGSDISGTFDDLNIDIQNIHSGDTYNITKNYKFDSKGQTIILQDRIITINQDNIVINGNGHTIDAGSFHTFAIFKVLGNNVTISNLTFTNSEPGCLLGPKIHDDGTFYYRYQKISSPIDWQGDNGSIKDCTFYNNHAVNGGAMTWMGNNGTINHCQFINNSARGVGGALYVGGENNTISNCSFVNSSSKLSEEAIFIDRNHKNIKFVNGIFKDNLPVIDGEVFNIDVNYLYYTYNNPVYDTSLDLIPLIYASLVKGGVNSIDESFSYFADYNNTTGVYSLSVFAHNDLKVSDYGSGPIDYIKSFIFSDITDFNQIYDSLLNKNYVFDITQVTTINIYNIVDYHNAFKAKGNNLWFDTDKGAKNVNRALKVVFKDKLQIDSHKSWELDDMGFNIINFIGNGSTINGGAKDRDEFKWIKIDNSKILFMANDLTIKKFNTAIECLSGTCTFNNIKFDENRMDYYVDRDWGAAILNTGIIVCNNCTFTNNYAKYGGAVFNQGFIGLNNCTFKGNTAYGTEKDVHIGNNVCIGDGGCVQVDNKNVTSDTSIVYFANSISMAKSTALTILSAVASFGAAFVVGALTLNPAAGILTGIAVAGVTGSLTAYTIISQTYDVNHDRATTALIVIGSSVIAGVIGGYMGYYTAMSFKQSPEVSPQNSNIYTYYYLEDGYNEAGEIKIQSIFELSDDEIFVIIEKIQAEESPLVHLQINGYENGLWDLFAVYEDGSTLDCLLEYIIW